MFDGGLDSVLPRLADALGQEQVSGWELEEYAFNELSDIEDLRNR